MRRVVLVGAGFLFMLAGVVFTLQGVGVLGGSVMSGVTFWAVAGPVIALAGLGVARTRPAGPGALAARARPPALAPAVIRLLTRRGAYVSWKHDWHGGTAIFSPPGP